MNPDINPLEVDARTRVLMEQRNEFADQVVLWKSKCVVLELAVKALTEQLEAAKEIKSG